jgi:hypothetical protein
MATKQTTELRESIVKGIKSYSREFSNGTQSLNFKGVYQLGDLKLAINIKRDSYDFQSYATITVWRPSDLSWSPVASIPYSKMNVVTSGIVDPYANAESFVHITNSHQISAFARDEKELLEKAKFILS